MKKSRHWRFMEKKSLPIVFVLALCLFILAWQGWECSPTCDERDHLAAGIAIVQQGDLGHYRVNPPIHKLVSGAAVELVFHPDIGEIHSASLSPIPRVEDTSLGEQMIAQNAIQYRSLFRVGRYVRLPFILFAGWLLAFHLPRRFQSSGRIAAILWFTSPLVLGHGWLIMPDAISGTAGAVVLTCSLHWLERPTAYRMVLSGLAWGFAIATKFTFCAIFLAWPLAIFGFRILHWKSLRHEARHFWLGLITQGCIALLVVILAYGGDIRGDYLGDHGFRSERLSFLNFQNQPRDGILSTLARVLARLPSPFPKQFMLGIDDQQIDLENGYPTYLFGQWFYGNAWWWIFPAYLLKEQMVVWGILLLLPAVCFATAIRVARRTGRGPRSRLCLRVGVDGFLFSSIFAAITFAVLALHGKMALNVRYLLPGLPALYLSLGIALSEATSRRSLRRLGVGFGLVLMALDLCLCLPHCFAYINPLGGGMYRVPAALHASNFDGGQDLWRLERWISEQANVDKTDRYICIHSDTPINAIQVKTRLPGEAALEHMIHFRSERHDSKGDLEIIVMRGLAAPAPWNFIIGGPVTAKQRQLIESLAATSPDEFLTPTLGIYRAHRD